MASDAASAPLLIKYDVLVNFRGTDTRRRFTSHLKEALDDNGINAFTDTGLRVGEEISPTLDSRIRESLASIVVFSPNYADSRWCLDELVRIMECKEANGQTVMPVFVQGVEPTHVRNQIGAFGDGFKELISDAKYANRKTSWQRALQQAADLAGLVTDEISEGVTVKELLKRIQSLLSPMSPIDLNTCFIGIERVKEIESLVLSPNIRCLGIWGMGGLGKTTLAKEIQKRVWNQFGGSCFVEKVGELVEMREWKREYWQRMSELLKMKDANQDIPTIRRKLKVTKVLIILDDVSDSSQLQELVREWKSYCPGGKMIAISRDKQILKNIECDKVHEVKALEERESLQLLKHHILKQREPTPVQEEVMKDVIKYTGGLPLALEVLGRYLFDKDITIWRSKLVKLGDIPDPDITKILSISFDGLDDDEKNIFLDIACFMKGWDKDHAESVLDASGFHAISGIDRLIDRALITISCQRIEMHDLLQQMGQDIGSRGGSRLCKTKEIVDLLTRKSQGKKMEGEGKIEGMSVEVPHDTSMELSPGVFENMTGLRILLFEDIYRTISFPEGLEYLPDVLRYFEWYRYPEHSLPPQFGSNQNLVELRMSWSNLRQLWTDETEPYLPNLKHVDLSSSINLTTVPNFRNSLKLEILNLDFCRKLEDIPDLSHLTKLVELNLSSCSEFRILRQLPPSLIELNLSFTKIKKLENTSIQGLSQLEHLFLYCCKELESLPDNICVLKNLGELNLDGCQKLLNLSFLLFHGSLRRLNFPWYEGETLPSLKSLVSLRELWLSGSNVKSLPEDIKYLTNLWNIDVSYCSNLNCIPELPPSLLCLDASYCTSLQKYTHLPYVEFDALLLSPIFELCVFGYHNLRMIFSNCIDLEKEARNVIWRDLWLRNQSIIPLLETGRDKYQWLSPIDACTPGNEVPEWFEYSDTGPYIQVNTNRHHPNGLYFLVVVGVPNIRDRPFDFLKVTCNGYSKSGETFNSSCEFDFDNGDIGIVFESEHTIVWYHHLGSHNNQFCLNGATFHFSAAIPCWDEDIDYGNGDDSNGDNSNGDDSHGDDRFIVKCGVTPFYFNDDGNDDDEDDDYNNKGRQRGSSSSILLAEEEPGDASDLELKFPAPVEEGQDACGFDLNFEDDIDLDLGFAPPAEERACLIDRSKKRKREHDQEEESRSHKRNS